MIKDSKILILGASGMVGSAIVRKLWENNYDNLLMPNSTSLDLTSQYLVQSYFSEHQPQYVFNCAGKVGGILANCQEPVEFLYDNAMIQLNVLKACESIKVNKVLTLGSSCIYPKNAEQPIKESALLTGTLEPTNEAYALAKILGVMMSKHLNKQNKLNAISLMPCNVYGYNDNYDQQRGHIIGALVDRFHKAKQKNEPLVKVWGSGKPSREFIFVDDLADACLWAMLNYNDAEHLNVGTGEEISVLELALKIKNLVGFNGVLEFDTTKPDGMMRKVMDCSKINSLGWQPKTSLDDGLQLAYMQYQLTLK